MHDEHVTHATSGCQHARLHRAAAAGRRRAPPLKNGGALVSGTRNRVGAGGGPGPGVLEGSWRGSGGGRGSWRAPELCWECACYTVAARCVRPWRGALKQTRHTTPCCERGGGHPGVCCGPWHSGAGRGRGPMHQNQFHARPKFLTYGSSAARLRGALAPPRPRTPPADRTLKAQAALSLRCGRWAQRTASAPARAWRVSWPRAECSLGPVPAVPRGNSSII